MQDPGSCTPTHSRNGKVCDVIIQTIGVVIFLLLEASLLIGRWKYAKHYEPRFRWWLSQSERMEAFSYAWAHGFQGFVMLYFFLYGMCIAMTWAPCFK